MTTEDKDQLIAKLQEATSENEAGRHGVANMLIQDARAILYRQPAAPAPSRASYMQSEWVLQVPKFEALGIDTKAQYPEQCVNALLALATLQPAAPAPASDEVLAELAAMDFSELRVSAKTCQDMQGAGQRTVKVDIKDLTRHLTRALAISEAAPALLARVRLAENELGKVQHYVASLLNDLLNHPELPASIQKTLWQHRQKLTVKGGPQDA